MAEVLGYVAVGFFIIMGILVLAISVKAMRVVANGIEGKNK